MTKRNSKGQFAKDATEGAQDYRDALITEYLLSVGKITKSIAEMSDKLDQIHQDIEQVRTLAHQTRTNSRGNTLVINKILAGVDLLKSGSSFMQEIQQHKGQPEEQPWVPKVGDVVVVIKDVSEVLKAGEICEYMGHDFVQSLFPSCGDGRWFTVTSNLRPATTAEIERHQAELKAKEEEEKRKKLVRGCRVSTPDGEGIYLGDDGDGDGFKPHRVSLDIDGPGIVRTYNFDQITPLP